MLSRKIRKSAITRNLCFLFYYTGWGSDCLESDALSNAAKSLQISPVCGLCLGFGSVILDIRM